MRVLKYPVALWHNGAEPKSYAFPIGATDIWGDVAYPLIDDAAWSFKGVLPQGIPVWMVAPKTGSRVECRLGGARKTVVTASWGIEDLGWDARRDPGTKLVTISAGTGSVVVSDNECRAIQRPGDSDLLAILERREKELPASWSFLFDRDASDERKKLQDAARKVSLD